MKIDKIILWFIGTLFSCNGVLSLKILGLFPYQGKSHFFVFQPYLHELAKRGHNLTVISYFPQKQPIDNYHDISLAGEAKMLEGAMPVYRSYWNMISIVTFLTWMGTENCRVLLANDKVQNLWKEKEKFDLILLEQFNSDCALGLAYKLGAPVVGMTSHALLPWHFDRYGIQYHPAYVSMSWLEGGTKPTLYQRVERVVIQSLCNIIYKYMQRIDQKELQQYFDVPPLDDLAADTRLGLIYTYYVLNGPNLYPSNVKEVGGYHVAKPKELPKELKKFIDESEHGVIYISFGSMLQAASTPQDKVEAIVAAISELPQRIVWKWDSDTLPGNPKNVFLSNWLPQNDILAHPNVKAFYSHCGLLGTTEAIYHGVPMIGMPVFGDQPGNAAAIEESGLGVIVQIKDLSKEILLEKIKTVMKPEFRSKVKELSAVWHDRPMSAMDSAIYWTEFAARSQNFTFRTPAVTVPLYQFIFLDVIAVFLGILLVTICVIKIVFSLYKKSNSRKIKTN